MLIFRKKDLDDVVVLFEYKDDIKLVCANGYKRHCYSVLASLIIDYEKQVPIIGIRVNIQCSICHFPQKKEN